MAVGLDFAWTRVAIAAAAVSCCSVLTAANAVAEPPDFDLSHAGPITGVSCSKVQFLAHVGNGDSGGPVYYRNADGTATPVGITIRAATADGGTVAELIGPWLARWSLSVDSS